VYPQFHAALRSRFSQAADHALRIIRDRKHAPIRLCFRATAAFETRLGICRLKARKSTSQRLRSARVRLDQQAGSKQACVTLQRPRQKLILFAEGDPFFQDQDVRLFKSRPFKRFCASDAAKNQLLLRQ
jgi:hypothetical protein